MPCMFFLPIFYEKMGKNITVPPTASHKFMGTNPHALYTAGNKEILDIIAQLPARAPQILDIPCISPVQQPNFDRLRISSGYGLRIHPITQKIHRHSGIDIPPSGNDTIYATANGILDTVAYNDLIGLHIKIRHKYGFKTTYGHLKRTFIRTPHQKYISEIRLA